ncbi:hypothetical protein DICPUDRAFT_79280 [Dictyostelium purpureum]|uniref:Uncharacterized protein n=1 Tax=Dictyostelium purpureum TaxID=5786 RepID=F0ZM42_DICPU|nr:uncharacterized protein DICPUDRAFT_79280 [Dictyostelium purpureum]EGC34960.1 hypothetical protein DICPUDRAFT_79280 [Dictyostelium purpureum]|eukprot:XP_003288485.1 hypothetical protein DICPUDRAFT_79280 [Dictyostelium purpureum]
MSCTTLHHFKFSYQINCSYYNHSLPISLPEIFFKLYLDQNPFLKVFRWILSKALGLQNLDIGVPFNQEPLKCSLNLPIMKTPTYQLLVPNYQVYTSKPIELNVGHPINKNFQKGSIPSFLKSLVLAGIYNQPFEPKVLP